jgi:probable phosphoglycerate mutase
MVDTGVETRTPVLLQSWDGFAEYEARPTQIDEVNWHPADCSGKESQQTFPAIGRQIAAICPLVSREKDVRTNTLSETFPVVYLSRHGETAWTITGQRTGLIDLPLTEWGECSARRLGERLSGLTFARVFTSPLQRVMRTCELAGFGPLAQIDRDLVEWDYGEYEGRVTADILAERPDWQLFREGCPGGKSPRQVAIRADRVVSRIQAVGGNALLFSSGHFLRILATRWLVSNPSTGDHSF